MSAPERIVGEPRCLLVFRVNPGRTTQLAPGDYPCTQPAGHDRGENPTPHTSVMQWSDVNDAKR